MKRDLALSFALLIASVVFLSPKFADAWKIKTALTDGCHEEMTIEAASFLFEENSVLNLRAPLPDDSTWKSVADDFLKTLDYEFDDPWQKFVIHSLIIGVRRPDDAGRSVSDASALRDAHSDPYTQSAHCLRSPDDNFQAGDLSALANTKEFINGQFEAMQAYLNDPPKDQIKKVSLYIEYYGQMEVSVWAPAYHVGIAAHTVQDSFSHTVRSDDLRVIRHVLNYIDAVTYDYDADRDGLRHSFEMDECHGGASEIASVAKQATGDFLTACFGGQKSDIDNFFEDWMSHEAGCNNDNDFCDSKWANLAREDPTKPFFGDLFSCSHSPSTDQSGLLFFLLALASFVFIRHLRSAARRPGSHAGR